MMASGVRKATADPEFDPKPERESRVA